MQALLDDDDPAVLLVVEPREQSLLVVVLDPLTFGRGAGIRRLHQIIDDQQIGTEAGDRAAQRHRFAKAPLRRQDLGFGVPPGVDREAGEQAPVPGCQL